MKKIGIIGAGLSGIMAANYFSNKNFDVDVFEKKGEQPFDHSGVLRFKDHNLGDYLGCSMDSVVIQKAFYYQDKLYDKCNIMMANTYSYKVTNEIHHRSVERDDGIRYILDGAPRIVNKNSVFYNKEVKAFHPLVESVCLEVSGEDDFYGYDFVISTLPMFVNLKIAEKQELYSKIDFKYSPVYTVKYDTGIKSTVNQTVYIISIYLSIYRVTFQNGIMIIESMKEIDGQDFEYCERIFFNLDFNLVKTRGNLIRNKIKIGKIIPIDDNLRRSAIVYLTNRYNVFSLGRYSIWKPGITADDVFEDIKRIERMINMGSVRREYESYTY